MPHVSVKIKETRCKEKSQLHVSLCFSVCVFVCYHGLDDTVNGVFTCACVWVGVCACARNCRNSMKQYVLVTAKCSFSHLSVTDACW